MKTVRAILSFLGDALVSAARSEYEPKTRKGAACGSIRRED